MRKQGFELLESLRARLDGNLDGGGREAAIRCQLAKELEEAGDYEGAQEALGERWGGLAERPRVEDLSPGPKAEYLLRAGALVCRIGKGRGLEGAQDTAITLISESAMLFDGLRETEKVAECWSEIGFCYWQKGDHGEARMALKTTLNLLGESKGAVRAIAVVRRALVENSAGRPYEAYKILHDEAPALADHEIHYISGMFRIAYANVLLYLSANEAQARAALNESAEESFADRALVEYAAAGFHFEQAGHKRHEARVRNNTGYLLFTLGRFDEAHENLDRAASLFESLGEIDSAAQVNETRARVLIAQDKPDEAERVAREAVDVLERGDDAAQLAQVLTTHGRALARSYREAEAKGALERAVETASSGGDREGAGQACLTMIEELADVLSAYDVWALYERADELLAETQRPETVERLRKCARITLRVGRRALRTDLESGWMGCNLTEEVLRYEGELIKEAMAAENGSITRAAELRLGMSHQALRSIIKGRQRNLLGDKYPARRRRTGGARRKPEARQGH